MRPRRHRLSHGAPLCVGTPGNAPSIIESWPGPSDRCRIRPSETKNAPAGAVASAGASWRRVLDQLDAGLLAHLEGLDDVADLDVVVVAQGKTALEALADLG